MLPLLDHGTAFEPDTDTGSPLADLLEREKSLSEPLKIHGVLRGDTALVTKTTLRRIIRVLEDYPRQDGYEVALAYVDWQMDLARHGSKTHKDWILGWRNQMAMHAKKNWTLRTDEQTAAEVVSLDFTPEDSARYK